MKEHRNKNHDLKDDSVIKKKSKLHLYDHQERLTKILEEEQKP